MKDNIKIYGVIPRRGFIEASGDYEFFKALLNYIAKRGLKPVVYSSILYAYRIGRSGYQVELLPSDPSIVCRGDTVVVLVDKDLGIEYYRYLVECSEKRLVVVYRLSNKKASEYMVVKTGVNKYRIVAFTRKTLII
ncbi:MAG: hypothetical protein ABWW65_03935 [Thermoprotei archaeon]